MLLANLTIAVQSPLVLTQPGGLTDQFYLMALICCGAAAALQIAVIGHPQRKPKFAEQQERFLQGARVIIPPLMLLVTYGVMIVTHRGGNNSQSYLMALGIGFMFLLVSARQVLTLWENVGLALALRAQPDLMWYRSKFK